jgi:hypothetical protein
VWGFGVRVAGSSFRPGYSFSLAPPREIDRLLGTFVQDEVSLATTLFLTFGCKFEHNDYSGFEFEPSAQLVWAAQPGMGSHAGLRRRSLGREHAGVYKVGHASWMADRGVVGSQRDRREPLAAAPRRVSRPIRVAPHGGSAPDLRQGIVAVLKRGAGGVRWRVDANDLSTNRR